MSDRLREHIFISYAWEDGALAEWLTLKLTAEGYKVWCDRFEILGGEKWPDDVDSAIRNDTFRMLHLVSRFSLQKPNPKKERELALALEKERGSEILIPLNIDGTKASDLPWRIIDVAYIPFASWSAGFAKLLKKLNSVDTPRPLLGSGRGIAATAFLKHNVKTHDREDIVSNLFSFAVIPSSIRRFQFSRDIERGEAAEIHRAWAFRNLGGKEALALTSPPLNISNGPLIDEIAREEWQGGELINGILSEHLVGELLTKTLEVRCQARGLIREPNGRGFYFPMHLLPHNKLIFPSYSSSESWLKVCGYRSFRGTKYRYHLGPWFQVRHIEEGRFVAHLRLRLHLQDERGGALGHRAAVARRKSIGRAWWNREWLNRQFALMHFLSEGHEEIAVGDTEGSVVLSARPLSGAVDQGIDEAFLDRIRVPEALLTSSDGTRYSEDD